MKLVVINGAPNVTSGAADEVWLTVDSIVVWYGSITDWSFALANPWPSPMGPPTPPAVAEAP